MEPELLNKQRPHSAHSSFQCQQLSGFANGGGSVDHGGEEVLSFWEAMMSVHIQCIHVTQSLVKTETKI